MSQTIKAQVANIIAQTMGQFTNTINQFLALTALRQQGTGVKDVARINETAGIGKQSLLGQAQATTQPVAPAPGPAQQGGPGVSAFAPGQSQTNVNPNVKIGQPVTGMNIQNF